MTTNGTSAIELFIAPLCHNTYLSLIANIAPNNNTRRGLLFGTKHKAQRHMHFNDQKVISI